MINPYTFEKTVTTVANLEEDDRINIGGIMYKIYDALTLSSGHVEIRMFPVFVDFLPELCTATLPGKHPIEIYNQQ